MPTLYQNMKTLKSFTELKENWNGHAAKPFSKKLIHQAIRFIQGLDAYQPMICPTANQSIQMEYEVKGKGYVELELFEHRIEYFFVDHHEKEEHRKFSYTHSEEIYGLIVGFHQK